jgi:hypothetical protein
MSPALEEKILQLEKSTKERLPNMVTLLKDIHAALRADPENVTLMSEEQIAIIVSGLEQQTQTYVVSESIKSKSPSKKLKDMLNDL